MNLLYWIVFGLITGSVAEFIAPDAQRGMVGTIVLGVIGAMVGGFLGSKFLGVGVTGFNLMSFAVAVGGSLLVIIIARSI